MSNPNQTLGQEAHGEKSQVRHTRYGKGTAIDAVPIQVEYEIKNDILENAHVVIGWDSANGIEVWLERVGKDIYEMTVDANSPERYEIHKEDMYLVKRLMKYLMEGGDAIDLISWFAGIIEFIRRNGDY